MDSCRLFIVAMHRSGASLLALWVKECGLDMGIRRTSRHEDRDFLEFHELLLEYNGSSMFTGIDRILSYDKYLFSKAKSILFLKNILSEQWGVKQPRASLFLDLWRKVNTGDTYYVTIVRDFWEVVSSMYCLQVRRLKNKTKDPVMLNKKLSELEKRKQEFHNLYLSMWIRYHEELIEHYELTEKGNHIFIWMEDFLNFDKQLFDYMTMEWKFDFTYVPASDLYKPGMLHELSESEFDFDPVLQERAIATEHKLKALALESKQFYNRNSGQRGKNS